MPEPRLLAVSDLHVAHPENRAFVDTLTPTAPGDWLIVAGDVAERIEDVADVLGVLAARFATVVWVPGNHELWSRPDDPLRGVARYERLVEVCRGIGVHTPQDPFPVWDGPGGPAVVAPLFTLYDYSFLPPGTTTSQEGLAAAHAAGVVCADEHVLHPDPFPDRAAWCAARIAESRRRLDALPADLPTVLVNHWPLTRLPTEVLRLPEFVLWCGTTATADWARRYRACAVVYGHLHIPRLLHEDGVRLVEASLGYPREWRRWPEWAAAGHPVEPLPRQVLPLAPR